MLCNYVTLGMTEALRTYLPHVRYKARRGPTALINCQNDEVQMTVAHCRFVLYAANAKLHCVAFCVL